jgi:hypothetical protein
VSGGRRSIGMCPATHLPPMRKLFSHDRGTPRTGRSRR